MYRPDDGPTAPKRETRREMLAMLNALFATRVTTSRMAEHRKNLVALRASDRFPEELWRRFRAVVAARGEAWIDVLRELIEGYVQRHETETKNQ